jgi:hypothetical protein
MEARGELGLARAGHEQMVERGTNAEPWPASMTAWSSASRDGFCENMLGEARSEVAGQSLCDDDDDESELERRRGSRKASEQESVAILPITAQQRVPALTSMAARRRAEPNVKASFGQKVCCLRRCVSRGCARTWWKMEAALTATLPASPDDDHRTRLTTTTRRTKLRPPGLDQHRLGLARGR